MLECFFGLVGYVTRDRGLSLSLSLTHTKCAVNRETLQLPLWLVDFNTITNIHLGLQVASHLGFLSSYINANIL
jgi:hypothetical protein